MPTTPPKSRIVQRIRHESRRRILTVSDVRRITPKMVRITFTGEDLTGFVSAAPDDHVKLFFPLPGEDEPFLPSGRPGETNPGEPTPVARDYTPRRYDPAAGTLTIDFSLHGGGPGANWAVHARPGLHLGVAGPRGSFVVGGDIDWYLLVADETGLPAVGRWLEELPGGTRVIAIVAVGDADEEQRLESRTDLTLTWVHRDAGESLETALAATSIPEGEGYCWIACESSIAKALRRHLVEDRHVPKDWIRAVGYWRAGCIAVHDKIED